MQTVRQVSRHEMMNQLTVEYNRATEFLARIYTPIHANTPDKERIQYATEARAKQSSIELEMNRLLTIKNN